MPSSIARCQALNANGVQCRKDAEYSVFYHGERFVNNNLPDWVWAMLCDGHSKSSPDRRKMPAKKGGERG